MGTLVPDNGGGVFPEPGETGYFPAYDTVIEEGK
jgi:hypothetical protein